MYDCSVCKVQSSTIIHQTRTTCYLQIVFTFSLHFKLSKFESKLNLCCTTKITYRLVTLSHYFLLIDTIAAVLFDKSKNWSVCRQSGLFSI